jgi:hypothetical protein
VPPARPDSLGMSSWRARVGLAPVSSEEQTRYAGLVHENRRLAPIVWAAVLIVLFFALGPGVLFVAVPFCGLGTVSVRPTAAAPKTSTRHGTCH